MDSEEGSEKRSEKEDTSEDSKLNTSKVEFI